ncbi:GTPase Era [uncultured Clostridium sp.]|nr:GTPase Era [uncultured Clostridium sp.]
MSFVSREKEFLKFSSILENLISIIENIEISIIESDVNRTYKMLNDIRYEIEVSLENLIELLHPFLLFIVGSGNYGKSTLINALIEDNLIKTKDLPNTWKLDLFCKSNNEKIEIIYNDKTVVSMSLEEGVDLINKEEDKFRKSRKKIFNILREHKLNKNLSIKDLKRLKLSLEEQYQYISDIVEVKYYFNKNGILNDFIIVDTPGLNQILSKSMVSSIKDYYIKSDGIIWIIDAQNIISKKSNDLISDINKLNKLYNSRKNMILVVNKMDVIESSDKVNVHKVKAKVKEIYSDIFDDIVFISAKNAVNGILNNDTVLLNKSNISILRSSINRHFKETSQENQIKSKHKNLMLMSQKIMKIIEEYKREVYKDISIYNNSNFHLNENINIHKKYIIDLLYDIKNKPYYKLIDIKEIETRLNDIEEICKKELNRLYENNYKSYSGKKNIEIEKIDFHISFTKNKNIIIDYNALKELNNVKEKSKDKVLDYMRSKSFKRVSSDDLDIKNQIYGKLNTLIDECICDVEANFELIKNKVELVKYNTFKEKYLSKEYINSHIAELEIIYNIVKNLR